MIGLNLFNESAQFCNTAHVISVMLCILNLCLEFSGG